MEVLLTPVDRDRFIAARLFADTTEVVVTFASSAAGEPDLLHAGPFTASRAVRA